LSSLGELTGWLTANTISAGARGSTMSQGRLSPACRLRKVLRRRTAEHVRRLVALLVCCTTCGLASTLAQPSAAAVNRPQLGRTIEVIPVSGRVFLESAHGRAVRVRSASVVPEGSTLDTRHGTVRIVSAVNGHGQTQSAEFRGGQFEASQSVGDGGSLQIQLVGGDFAACHDASAAAANRSHPVRTLHTITGYQSGVRASGRYGSAATVRGEHTAAREATWDTVDRCSGTSIIDHVGDVKTAGHEVPVSFGLTPKETIAYKCSKLPPVSSAYCAVVRGTVTKEREGGTEVTAPADHLTLVTKSPSATEYSLDISAPNSFTTDSTYPLSRPDRHGFRRSDVSCVPDEGAGTYEITWRLDHRILASIEYRAEQASPVHTPCASFPFGRAIPADLTQTVTSAQGHFLVHYTTDPADTVNESTRADAETVAATAESALAYDETTLGMPSYADDGDGKLDIYIEGQTASHDTTFITPLAGRRTLPAYGQPAAVYLAVPPSQINDRFNLAFTLFGALRNADGYVLGLEPAAFSYSTNEWAANNFTQFDYEVPSLSQPLDCDATCPEDAAYSQWRFYQHLAEQFGDPIVAQLVSQDAADVRAQAVPQMDEALQQVLAARGTSLAAQLSGYALEDASDGWQAPWVGKAGIAYVADGVQMTADPAGAVLSVPSFSVDHLAIRQLVVTVPSLAPCVTDVLSVDTNVPSGGSAPGAGVLTQQRFEAIPSTALSPSTEEVVVPFDSCSGAVIRIPFVNGTTDTNAMPFTVNASLQRN
jgi:hypothetical protein